MKWLCLDCGSVGELNVHGRCSCCDSNAVAVEDSFTATVAMAGRLSGIDRMRLVEWLIGLDFVRSTNFGVQKQFEVSELERMMKK